MIFSIYISVINVLTICTLQVRPGEPVYAQVNREKKRSRGGEAGPGQGLGYQALLKDLGIDVPLRVWTDSSAAIGICNRQGLGKLRHLDTHTLWVQQAVRSGRGHA